MHVTNQPNAQRELAQLAEPPFEGIDVVENLLYVRVRGLATCLHLEDVCQRRLGALDASGRKRLAQKIWPDQQMRVGHQLPHPGESSKGSLRVRQQPNRRCRQLDCTGYRLREVGHVAVTPERAPRLAIWGRCIIGELHNNTLASLKEKAKNFRDRSRPLSPLWGSRRGISGQPAGIWLTRRLSPVARLRADGG